VTVRVAASGRSGAGRCSVFCRVNLCRAAMISNGEMVTDRADAPISLAIFGSATVAIDQLTSIAAVKAVAGAARGARRIRSHTS